QREQTRIEIRLRQANEEVPKLEAERDAVERAASLEMLKEKSSSIVRAVGAMDDGISKMAAAKQEIDGLCAECVDIAQNLGLPTAKYANKFQSELKRALNWQVLRSDDNLALWSGELKKHYSQPLAVQLEKLLFGSGEVGATDAEASNVIKLVEKAS